MVNNRIQQLTQAELLAQNAELQAKLQRVNNLLVQNQNENKDKGDPKCNNKPVLKTHPKETVPPKEKKMISSLFSGDIMQFQMPKHFTLPTTLKAYEGLGDPHIHITKFQFSKLPTGSISNFEDLAEAFTNHFASSKIYVHGSDYLNTIKQGQHESLKDYMTQFAKATMEIPNLSLDLSAEKKPLDRWRLKSSAKHERANKQPLRREKEKNLKTPQNRDAKKPFKLTPKFDTYARFNTERENIINEILHAKIIKPPRRAGNYQDQRFVTKHCAFHQKFGHTTDECVIAKDLLERLARQGLLD
ncbi:uncharacterized protein LOC107470219 [Arachis duranensis]|uniref:Uncharacterized protein LOC107470219 n=1 Tax=Arachis duranensis TaxID=130453 RepID=A0A6P4C9K3_ARADU|nr:uncharacterized protein LOC107470219 [Arachis duranensis]